MPRAVILSQGDEVVTGQVIDSNAAWLAQRLTELGFDVVEHLGVRDEQPEIEGAIQRAASIADVVVCTGGLGPTEDDLTARAVANVTGHELVLDEVALAHIQALYARYNRPMPKVNEKQAWLPTHCLRLDNDWGTAPAFAVEYKASLMTFLPGVPREMKALWHHRVQPLLAERFDLAPGLLVTLLTTGIGESNLQERIGTFHEPDVVLSYRTKLPENHIKLRFRPSSSTQRIEAVTQDVLARIGSPVFAIERPGEVGGSLHATVANLLLEQRATLSTAESCTGGLVASQLTTLAGASGWFVEGAVTYSNEAKVRALGVSAAQLQEHGAVSESVARAMAEGMRHRAATTWAIATTGIAGPGGGTPDKPVGTVHIAVAGPEQTHHRLLHLGGNRVRIQALTAGAALDLLRRALTSLLSSP